MPVRKNDLAPRFDLATEVLIAQAEEGKIRGEPRIILLPRTSGEELCGLIMKEDIATVICGGIEETHYQYLVWKKIQVVEGIIGPCEEALRLFLSGGLKPGTILPGAISRSGDQ